MTWTKKQQLPALHQSGKVKNPDMPEVEQQNYTSTVLKYANLALPFPQLETEAKRIVPAINELKRNAYILPPATHDTLGGVKIGSGISVTDDGTISTSGGGGSYEAGVGIYFSNDDIVINAEVGRLYSRIDYIDNLTSEQSIDESGQISDDWIDSGEVSESGRSIYKTNAGTHGLASGDSLCTISVSGYESVYIDVKQDSFNTDFGYVIIGNPDTDIDVEDADTWYRNYKGDSSADYLTASIYMDNLGGNHTVQVLYHKLEIPESTSGDVSVNLNNGQWVDTGTTVDGHTVYKSDAGSWHIDDGASVCTLTVSDANVITLYCKQNSEYDYDYVVTGEVDGSVSRHDYHKSFGGQDNVYAPVTYILSPGTHTIQIMYTKDGSGTVGEDRGYFYYDLAVPINPDATDRSYMYFTPNNPIILGEIFNDYENNIANSKFSHAEGEHTKAIANAAHSEGSLTVASGWYSHAEGYDTKASSYYAHSEGEVTTASGTASHAEGYYTTASGQMCHAEGIETTASGDFSHAEGYMTTASGDASHAENRNTVASGENSHAEGRETHAEGIRAHAEGGYTYATASNSHAEGERTQSTANAAHSEGYYTSATAAYSHAEGCETAANSGGAHSEGNHTVADGAYAHAEGDYTVADGKYSHSEGAYGRASGDASHVEGGCISTYSSTKYNIAAAYGSHTEGIGSKNQGIGGHVEGGPAIKGVPYYSRTTYSSGDLVYDTSSISDGIKWYKSKVDNNKGNSLTDTAYWDTYLGSSLSDLCYVGGTGEYGTTNYGIGGHAEGLSTANAGNGGHAEGTYGFFDDGSSSYVFNTGEGGHAEGCGSINHGQGGHAEGIGSYNTAMAGHTEGYVTKTFGLYSHAEGYRSQAAGTSAHVEGYQTNAANTAAHAEGYQSSANYLAAHAEGYTTFAYANYAHTQNLGTQVVVEAGTAIGKYNEYVVAGQPPYNAAFTIGNGTDSDHRSNAFRVDFNGNVVASGDITTGVLLNTSAQTLGAAINEISVRVPAPPNADGHYTLSLTITNGVPTYSWVSS